MALKSAELSESELDELQGFLARIKGGLVPNVEALEGFLAALACCPDTIFPTEYMPTIQSGLSEDGDLVFEDVDEATRFMMLVGRQWNHVNAQLRSREGYLPLLLEGARGKASTSAWANGFIRGTELSREIWSEMFEDGPVLLLDRPQWLPSACLYI